MYRCRESVEEAMHNVSIKLKVKRRREVFMKKYCMLYCFKFEAMKRHNSIPRNIFQSVQCGSVGSALACCKASPSSNLGSAPHAWRFRPLSRQL
jgi:hypothetical protein